MKKASGDQPLLLDQVVEAAIEWADEKVEDLYMMQPVATAASSERGGSCAEEALSRLMPSMVEAFSRIQLSSQVPPTSHQRQGGGGGYHQAAQPPQYPPAQPPPQPYSQPPPPPSGSQYVPPPTQTSGHRILAGVARGSPPKVVKIFQKTATLDDCAFPPQNPKNNNQVYNGRWDWEKTLDTGERMLKYQVNRRAEDAGQKNLARGTSRGDVSWAVVPSPCEGDTASVLEMLRSQFSS
ncbi:hypothetical protein DBV05_g10530 [Lasiodiplodia theobromae]|uniref:Uncharacterized protein n=1 Tax=Lasiodiplodia theobromae TaxID=45133 RepID=A0A5N5CZJ1_9PEZI|nr:hypothetical protein DBV05_g10530 [Lasiodiplodia theobromae]